ncbi:C40 family peptidase [Actinospica durhamensis]|uniref:C40 family peptidase n=1 Tax=Actinospica durhamensis TaxID=1508375 RepID=A0A941EY41_9ACTN|nr:C40 family peptidase [Actinospica durhamensis]MBR7839181.1 C40 family peptidase [Actinospica durhamensis]
MSAHCPQKRPARKTFTAVAVGASALISPLLMQADAHAEVAEPISQAEYEQELNAAATADEAYDAALTQAAKLQQRIDALQAQISSDTCAKNSLQRTLGLQAALQYQGGAMSGLELVLDASPSAYLNDALVGNEIADENTRSLRSLDQDEARLAAEQGLVQADLAQQQAAVDAAQARKDAALAAARRAQEIFDALGGAGQQAVTQAGEGVNPGRVHLTAVAPNARAAAAVAYAESKVGDPYVYGAAGPAAFDCSGLTMSAWARGGVALPHNAAAQASMLPAVDVSQLEPGDLVFYSYDGGAIEHVAVYVGNGLVVHSPRPGEDVQYGNVFTVGPIVRVGRVTA